MRLGDKVREWIMVTAAWVAMITILVVSLAVPVFYTVLATLRSLVGKG